MDKAEFSRQYETLYRDLYHFALYTLRNSSDAEDVVSETVLDACRGLHRLRDDSRFKAWIFKILTVKCKHKLKEYANRPDSLDQNQRLESIGSYEKWNVEESQDIRNAFGKLDSQERLIISLSIFGGYNSREIGRHLLMRDTTVRSKLSRALNKMQKLLDA